MTTARTFPALLLLALCLAACPGDGATEAPAAAGLHWLSSDVAYGGREASAESLAGAGIRTVVGVDATPPDAEAAKRHGLRVVHLPFGHAGIPEPVRLRIAKLVRELEGPFFFRGTDGRSRGPAAAAIAEMTLSGLSGGEAAKALGEAGVSPDYVGLLRDVREYRPPSEEETRRHAFEFAPSAEASTIARAMARLSSHVRNLRASRAAVWSVPTDRPDMDPPGEALGVIEQLTGLLSAEEVLAKPESFGELLADAMAAVQEIEVHLQEPNPDPEVLEMPWKRLKESCKQCHAAFRNK
ncbi:MAG: hypothetical protein ACYTDY_17900 [Planctomycetota bacterium]|jgi:hypothetical protein